MGIGYRHFGFLSFGEGDGLRFTWLQIICPGHIAFEVYDRGPHHDDRSRWSVTIGLALFTIYLSMPFLNWLNRDLSEDGESGFGDTWGFSYRFGREWGESLHLNWGGRCKIVHMPWSMIWVRTSYLAADGNWLHEKSSDPKDFTDHWHWKKNEVEPAQWREAYPYSYTLKNGTVQNCTATVTVDEMEWRRRGWPWSKVGRKVRQYIDITFDAEVGERAGSWKGGVLGCSYDLRPGETPLQCLRRMERERKFK